MIETVTLQIVTKKKRKPAVITPVMSLGAGGLNGLGTSHRLSSLENRTFYPLFPDKDTGLQGHADFTPGCKTSK
jgi:hypothetical protein